MQSYRLRIVSIFGIAIAISAAILYARISHNVPSRTYHVNLTESGFTPRTIAINKGDTIVFTSSRGKPFWPASDLHPTHEIYPEFDPKNPVSPEDSWPFRFNRTGKWEYHDHLDPYFRGTIEVRDSVSKKLDSAAAADVMKACDDRRDTAENLQCWQGVVREQLEAGNLDGAFAALDAFTQKNPTQLGSCHGMVHEIGEQAFKLFNQKKDFALSPKTSYCGYGFYHGFMETLLHETDDIGQARAFCDYADAKLKSFIADAGGACIHGIGHGAVDDTPNPSVWGDAQKIVSPALALCERVARGSDEVFRCASGAFNALEIISDEGRYKLSANTQDPFWICREQPEKYKRSCYTQFLVSAMNVAHNDFSKTATFIDTIKEDAYAKETLAGVAVERARLPDADYGETVSWCRSLASRFHISCITGFAEGFLKYGPPEFEYIKAKEFCSSSLLSGEERAPCFERILSILRNFYPVAKSREICASVERQYQLNNCEYN